MIDKIIDQIEASIHLSDGRIIKGSFDSENNSFSFNGFSKTIKIEKVIDEQNVVVSYMFDTDYLPKRFLLNKESPLIIKDYLCIKEKDEYIEIVIRII